MSRTVEWSAWRSSRTAVTRESVHLIEGLSRSRRAGSKRTRSVEDVKVINRMMHVELRRRIATGRLVRRGPREYELHPAVR
jgi:hypothetical protein